MITVDEPNIPLSCTGSLSSQAGGIGLVSLDEVILERVQRERARLMATVPNSSVGHTAQL